MLTEKQYYAIHGKLWELKTPEEFDTFRDTVLEKLDENDPYLQTLVNFYGQARALREEGF